MGFLTDLRFAFRSLLGALGLTLTIVVTLALGIGANAAIFSLVRGVLLRPLANRDENRLVYIRQSAPGLGADNANFSVPEIRRPPRAADHAQPARRLLDDQLHDDRPRRAAHRERRRRRRLLLQRDGPPAGPRPADRCHGRRAERGRCGRADASLLDDNARERSRRHRQGREARRPCGDHRRRPGAVGAVSAGDRDHRQRRDESRITCRPRWSRAACTG